MREFAIFDESEFWVALRQASASAHPRAFARLAGMTFEVVRFRHLLAMRVPEAELAKSQPGS